jgi:hypothetical protein
MTDYMGVYSMNSNSLIRTSSLPNSVVADQSSSLQFTTTFTDESLACVKADVTPTYSKGMIQFPILYYKG